MSKTIETPEWFHKIINDAEFKCFHTSHKSVDDIPKMFRSYIFNEISKPENQAKFENIKALHKNATNIRHLMIASHLGLMGLRHGSCKICDDLKELDKTLKPFQSGNENDL